MNNESGDLDSHNILERSDQRGTTNGPTDHEKDDM